MDSVSEETLNIDNWSEIVHTTDDTWIHYERAQKNVLSGLAHDVLLLSPKQSTNSQAEWEKQDKSQKV